MDYKRLSKTVAHALRHDPAAYGLQLDAEGWVDVEDLLAVLRTRNRAWRNLVPDDLDAMLASASKKRYEISDGRIRAYYGHSTQERIEKTAHEPPAVLFHGTSPQAAQIILTEGLRPMNRQYVHLSTDVQTARLVGGRHDAAPVLLTIDAASAHAAGVGFYPGNDDVWLSDSIPPAFITLTSDA